MKISDISYEEALRRHPKEVAGVVAKLRAGKSKSKGEDPANLGWSYECCVRIESGGMTLAEVFGGEAERRERIRRETPLEDQVVDQLRRTTVWISARIGKWIGRSEALEAPPPELETNVRANLQARDAEQARVDALSPEERKQEVERLLKQLGRDPGFAAYLLED